MYVQQQNRLNWSYVYCVYSLLCSLRPGRSLGRPFPEAGYFEFVDVYFLLKHGVKMLFCIVTTFYSMIRFIVHVLATCCRLVDS